MTIWCPRLDPAEGSLYQGLADALVADIRSGRLPAGERLPTHRDLAQRLGVTVGTVSRAYAEVLRRGLIVAEVGRGTFVAEPPEQVRRPNWDCVPQFAEPGRIALHMHAPTGTACEESLREALREVADCACLDSLLCYQDSAGVTEHREAGAAWCARFGKQVDPAQLAVTAGTQHGLQIALGALLRAGDVLLTEALSYQGTVEIARQQGVRVEAVAMDQEGMCPEALAQACKKHSPKALYTTPNFQNPTGIVMPQARREAIAAVAQDFGVVVVEDDICAFYLEEHPSPVSELVGELGVYLTGISKAIAPGLRVGFIHAPQPVFEGVVDALWASTVMAPPLMAELFLTLQQRQQLDPILQQRRALVQRRQRLVRAYLGAQVAPGCDPRGPNVWLELPEPWRAGDFVQAAAARKVSVAPPSLFGVGRAALPHAVRISLVAQREDGELERGLGILAELMQEPGGGRDRAI